MIKIIFCGESDLKFTKGKVYNLINFLGDINYVYAFITNDRNEISLIPYEDIESFNMNWEVVSNDRKNIR